MTSKRVIITAGPTSEPIDQVRRLTNHSTGSLGSQLAERCREEGYEVVMLRSRHCVVPPPRGLDQVIPFDWAKSGSELMKGNHFTFKSYPMAHHLNSQCIQDVREFIEQF